MITKLLKTWRADHCYPMIYQSEIKIEVGNELLIVENLYRHIFHHAELEI